MRLLLFLCLIIGLQLNSKCQKNIFVVVSEDGFETGGGIQIERGVSGTYSIDGDTFTLAFENEIIEGVTNTVGLAFKPFNRTCLVMGIETGIEAGIFSARGNDTASGESIILERQKITDEINEVIGLETEICWHNGSIFNLIPNNLNTQRMVVIPKTIKSLAESLTADINVSSGVSFEIDLAVGETKRLTAYCIDKSKDRPQYDDNFVSIGQTPEYVKDLVGQYHRDIFDYYSEERLQDIFWHEIRKHRNFDLSLGNVKSVLYLSTDEGVTIAFDFNDFGYERIELTLEEGRIKNSAEKEELLEDNTIEELEAYIGEIDIKIRELGNEELFYLVPKDFLTDTFGPSFEDIERNVCYQTISIQESEWFYISAKLLECFDEFLYTVYWLYLVETTSYMNSFE